MVTHEIEGGKMKCHRYWPDPTSSPPSTQQSYGEYSLTYLSAVVHKHYILRKFEMTHNGETRNISQYAYTSWPDHGVPLTTGELLGYRNAVNHAVGVGGEGASMGEEEE